MLFCGVEMSRTYQLRWNGTAKEQHAHKPANRRRQFVCDRWLVANVAMDSIPFFSAALQNSCIPLLHSIQTLNKLKAMVSSIFLVPLFPTYSLLATRK